MIGPQAERGNIAFDDALKRLAARGRRKSEWIALLFSGALAHDEPAEAREISPATMHRVLTPAKAWLDRELGQESA